MKVQVVPCLKDKLIFDPIDLNGSWRVGLRFVLIGDGAPSSGAVPHS